MMMLACAIIPPMNISFRLHEILSENKMTVRELSQKANIHYRTALNMYHNRTSGIQFDVLYKVCKVLKVTPDELLNLEDLYRTIKK